MKKLIPIIILLILGIVFLNFSDVFGQALRVFTIQQGGTGTSTLPLDGQLLIGSGGSYKINNLTAGSNITITNASGTITLASTGGSGGGVSTSSPFTAGYIPYATSSSAITNSNIFQLGSYIGIGTTTPAYTLHTVGSVRFDLGSDATSDIFYRSSTGNLGRLGIGTTGKVLMASSTATGGISWEPVGGTGTVTSVAMSTPTGLTISGSPITTAGTLALTWTAGYEGLTTASSTAWNAKQSAITLASSTTGTDFTITNTNPTWTFNLPSASGSNRGLLTSTDWTTFNNKQATISAGSNIVLTGASVAVTSTPLFASLTLTNPLAVLQGGTGLTSGYNNSNWDTAYTDRLKWDGGSTGLVAATGRTSLELGSMALLANTGSSSIITVGTIGAGTWNGTAIEAGYYGAATIDGDDINSNLAGRSLTLTAASPDTLDVDAELFTNDFSISFINATTTQNGSIQKKSFQAITITQIDCSTNGSNITIGLDERASSTPQTAGVDIFNGGSMACVSTNTSTSTFANAGIAAGALISLDVDAAANATTTLRVHIQFTKDD